MSPLAARTEPRGPEAPIILGTAGHIDHGKTALVRALTGVDCDRLPEEKKRGITIELGFAHLELGGWRFGIVDVPGHERFVRAMVAGAGGIDLVMLVVAADEGIMPQTREHLDICQLLSIPRGVVALTKSDSCEGDWLRLVTDDVKRTLHGTFLQDSPIVPCSAVTGAGIDALRGALLEVVREVPPKDPEGILRLPLDRVFTMKGFGTVVTGTLLSGSLGLGEDVEVLPGGATAKVRGLQVHSAEAERALAGQRTAVNLQGSDRTEIRRGGVVVRPGTLEATSILDCYVHYLSVCRRPLKNRARLLFHAGTTQVMGTCILLEPQEIPPGGKANVQLHLDEPVVVLPNDRFILRGFETQENYGTTLGGGEVVRVLSRKVRRADAKSVELLSDMRRADPAQRVALEVAGAESRGLTRHEIARRVPYPPRKLTRLLDQLSSQGALIRFDRDSEAVVHRDAVQALSDQLLDLVGQHHQDDPLSSGLSKEEARSKLPSVMPPKLFHAVLERLSAAKALSVERETVRLPSHRIESAAAPLQQIKERVAKMLESAALSPPRVVEIPAQLDLSAREVGDALKLLLQTQRSIKVGELHFARTALDRLRKSLQEFLASNGTITPQQWKQLSGVSRKFAIPLAEHFDAEKLTVRVGEVRKLRGRS